MEQVVTYRRPELRDPTMIVAFAGWNDAAEVATSAVKHLVRQFDASKFASVDSEEFYVFTETRPVVRIAENNQRRIDWPANDFYCCTVRGGDRDLILIHGIEPQLKWRAFSSAIIGVATDLQARLIVTLGGLLADVPHTRPPRLTGSASLPELRERMTRLDTRSSRYEGPTGIIGVIGNTAKEAGIETASIWGNVPHYISATGNPRVSAAILAQLGDLLDIEIDTSELMGLASSFDRQVEEAISGNPEVAEYVRRLEERGASGEDDETSDQPPADLPSSDALIKDLEEFFKRRSTGENDDPKK